MAFKIYEVKTLDIVFMCLDEYGHIKYFSVSGPTSHLEMASTRLFFFFEAKVESVVQTAITSRMVKARAKDYKMQTLMHSNQKREDNDVMSYQQLLHSDDIPRGCTLQGSLYGLIHHRRIGFSTKLKLSDCQNLLL